MEKTSNKVQFLAAFLFYIGLSVFIHGKFIFEFPRHIHAWAHTDHIALSHGFFNNGMDFFHPETYTFNKQFDMEDSKQSDKITSTDFPINNYLVALIMKVTNNKSTVIFRLYTLIVSCIGMAFLFLFIKLWGGNLSKSLLLPTLLVMTPVYLDYQVGFLPSTPALSIFFAASYFISKYFKLNQNKNLILGVVLLTLAALIRTPFFIHLISFCCWRIIVYIKTRKLDFKIILPCSIGLLIPILYFLYNSYLRTNHGSIFLGEPLPPNSLKEIFDIIQTAFGNWQYSYFNKVQWIIIPFALLYAFTFSIFHPRKKTSQFTIWLWISFVGATMYSLLIFKQFVNHDYYIIDTFYPVLFVTTTLFISTSGYIQKERVFNLSLVLILVASIASMKISSETLRERRAIDSTNDYNNQYLDYLGSGELLKKNGIEKDAKILIVDSYAPNMSFVLNGYSGFSLIKRDREHYIEMLNYSAQYLLVSSRFFSKPLYPEFPEILTHFTLLDQDNNLLLMKRTPPQTKNLFTFFGLNQFEPKCIIDENSKKIDFGESPFKIEQEELYESTLKHTIQLDDSIVLMEVTFDTKSLGSNSNTSLILEWKEEKTDEQLGYYSFKPFSKKYFHQNRITVLIPKSKGNIKLVMFLFNPEGETLEYKNLQVKLF